MTYIALTPAHRHGKTFPGHPLTLRALGNGTGLLLLGAACTYGEVLAPQVTDLATLYGLAFVGLNLSKARQTHALCIK
jgi:hypothetical protein